MNNALDSSASPTNSVELPTPAQDERCAFIGKTGSGKTVLMKDFLSVKPNFHLLDTKLAKSYKDGGKIGKSVYGENIYKNLGPGKFVWHTPDDFNVEYNSDAIERYFATVYSIGNRVIAIDELLDIGTSSYTPFSVHRAYTRGREKGLGVWAGMQRPSGIIPSARTEVEHKYLFYLEEEIDRSRMESAFDYPIPWTYLKREEFSFLYCDPRGNVEGPFKLSL